MSNIEDLINSVVDQDFAKAGPMFSEIMQQKIADSLDQERIKVAGVVFNDAEDDDEDLEDISDEEIDEIVDEEEAEE